MSPDPTAPSAATKCLFIKQQLLQGMRTKRFTDMLPSENQLAAAFGVSRMTARRALVELENEGLVVRVRGKGTFIKKADPAMGYFVVQPSRTHARSLEVSYATRVLELRALDRPPREVVRRLDYDGPTVLARRLHFFDDQPVRYEIRHLRGDLCGSVLFEDLEKVSIHELLVDRLDLPLTRVWQRITAVVLDAETAAVFGETVGHPAFHILRTTFTHDTAVTSVEYFIRGELAFEDSFVPGRAGPPADVAFGH
ncbi:MAG TPA: GntR family transcriptional regulator [Desulfosarcina sp.]|nr:GntR family transcriptional regulator [Desulfosarcina sp.]